MTTHSIHSVHTSDWDCEGCRDLGLAYSTLLDSILTLADSLERVIYRHNYHDDPVTLEYVQQTLRTLNDILVTHQGDSNDERFRPT